MSETYKGIEFVRISNLPEDQKSRITQTIDHSKIIKILRGKELLHDCVQLNDYAAWMKETYNKRVAFATDHQISKATISSLVTAQSTK